MSRANEEGVDDERLAREICDVHSPKKKVDEHFFVSSEKRQGGAGRPRDLLAGTGA